MRPEDIKADQVWRHKRDPFRRVTITHVELDPRWPHVDVRRNTSRRRQPISIRTLLRSYELYLTNLPR